MNVDDRRIATWAAAAFIAGGVCCLAYLLYLVLSR